MKIVAPNLGALIGDTVGARLISHAGPSCPSSAALFIFLFVCLELKDTALLYFSDAHFFIL